MSDVTNVCNICLEPYDDFEHFKLEITTCHPTVIHDGCVTCILHLFQQKKKDVESGRAFNPNVISCPQCRQTVNKSQFELAQIEVDPGQLPPALPAPPAPQIQQLAQAAPPQIQPLAPDAPHQIQPHSPAAVPSTAVSEPSPRRDNLVAENGPSSSSSRPIGPPPTYDSIFGNQSGRVPAATFAAQLTSLNDLFRATPVIPGSNGPSGERAINQGGILPPSYYTRYVETYGQIQQPPQAFDQPSMGFFQPRFAETSQQPQFPPPPTYAEAMGWSDEQQQQQNYNVSQPQIPPPYIGYHYVQIPPTLPPNPEEVSQIYITIYNILVLRHAPHYPQRAIDGSIRFFRDVNSVFIYMPGFHLPRQ